MKKNIEVEIRGRVAKEKRDEVASFLDKKGKFIEQRERILLDYSTFLPGEGLKNRQKDIRLRVTNKIPEIIVKLGAWGVDNEERKELSVKASPGEFDKLVEIFGQLGYTKAILAIRLSVIYEYKNIEWALVEVPGHSFYWEAEKLLARDEDSDQARAEIRQVAQELGLAEWQGEEFIEYMRELNDQVNEVFEFDKYKEGDLGRRFKL